MTCQNEGLLWASMATSPLGGASTLMGGDFDTLSAIDRFSRFGRVQWQKVAAHLGQSVHELRTQFDPVYVPPQETRFRAPRFPVEGVNGIVQMRVLGQDHYMASLTTHEVELIRELYADGDGLSYREIALKFEISKWSVRDIVKGRRRLYG